MLQHFAVIETVITELEKSLRSNQDGRKNPNQRDHQVCFESCQILNIATSSRSISVVLYLMHIDLYLCIYIYIFIYFHLYKLIPYTYIQIYKIYIKYRYIRYFICRMSQGQFPTFYHTQLANEPISLKF